VATVTCRPAFSTRPTDGQARERPALPAHRRQQGPASPDRQKQRLTIERLANDGRGIAFFEGRTWFVIGALAGEEVEARVLGAHGKVVEAHRAGVQGQRAAPPDAVRTQGVAVAAACSTCPMTNNLP
jgi:predicted RNA-binding protein with TRAM domain